MNPEHPFYPQSAKLRAEALKLAAEMAMKGAKVYRIARLFGWISFGLGVLTVAGAIMLTSWHWPVAALNFWSARDSWRRGAKRRVEYLQLREEYLAIAHQLDAHP